MTPQAELLERITERRSQVRSHPGWDSGPERICDLLRLATRLRAQEIDNGLVTDVPWESLLGLLISWHHELRLGEGSCPEERSFELVRAALEFTRLEHLDNSVRYGAYEVRRIGNGFRIRHRWDPAVEAADAFLERQAEPTGLPNLSGVERRWIDNRPVDSREGPPAQVLQASTDRALDAIRAWRTALPEGHLPDSFPLGDRLSVGKMTLVLAGLMGLASLSEGTARRLKRLETTLVHLPRARLLQRLTQLCPTVPKDSVDAALERLTYRVGRSTRSSPLVELGQMIILCPPLLTPRAADVIMLRAAASDTRRFGAIGRQLGDRARAWAQWFSAIPGVTVAERVQVRAQDGQSAGDLDLVALDPAHGIGVCLEIKWPIDALTWPEVTSVERCASSAARQLSGLRRALTSGLAVAGLPTGWPTFTDVDWTWCVGTPQQLCLRPLPASSMHTTSLRYMHNLGKPTRLADVVDILRVPDLPREGVHFRCARVRFPVGPQLVSVDAIEITVPTWCPRLR